MPGGAGMDLNSLMAGGAGMDLNSLMAGGAGMDLNSLMGGGMDPSLAIPNHCCAHGALHCTVAGFNPDPSLVSSLPPIEQQQLVGSSGMYDLSAARTPHGGIKPVKVTAGDTGTVGSVTDLICRKPSSRRRRISTTRRGPERV